MSPDVGFLLFLFVLVAAPYAVGKHLRHLDKKARP